jgi:DNA-binding transcriptional ArsR family regulator
MKKYLSLFRRLGLSDKEARIYLDLLAHGMSSVAAVVERTGLHRPEAYRYLPVLRERGFVSEVRKGKRRLFTPESPAAVRGLVQGLSRDADALLPELEGMYARAERRPHVKFAEGPKAVTAVFADIVDTLRPGATFYRVSAERDVDRANAYLPADYRARRDAKNLERYVIMSERSARKKRPRLERDLVVIPPSLDEFDDDVQMIVYGDRVAYIEYGSETAVTIHDPNVAKFQAKLCRLLFRALKGRRTA